MLMMMAWAWNVSVFGNIENMGLKIENKLSSDEHVKKL